MKKMRDWLFKIILGKGIYVGKWAVVLLVVF